MGRWINPLCGAAGVADGSHPGEVNSGESIPAARRIAWAAVLLIGVAFSYSIGWQRGWMDGNSGSEERFDQLNETLLNTRAATAAQEAGEDFAGNV